VRVIKEAGWLRPRVAGGNIYLTDATTGKPKRHHRSRVVGYKPQMHRADAEKILAAELAAINGGPVTRAADGTITFGN